MRNGFHVYNPLHVFSKEKGEYMRFAILNGERHEAYKGLLGICPSCEKPVIAKCGELKIHHWAHKGKIECDGWWENETEWHREWKSHFPIAWQEKIHDGANNEKHIADVKTDHDLVIEFQHSALKPEEHQSRNEFYKKIVWVVNGKRLKNDEIKFFEAINRGTMCGSMFKTTTGDWNLLRFWSGNLVPVYFDFGKAILWLVMPNSSKDVVYFFPCRKVDFLEIYGQAHSQKAQVFENFLNEFQTMIQSPNQNKNNAFKNHQKVSGSKNIQVFQIKRNFRL